MRLAPARLPLIGRILNRVTLDSTRVIRITAISPHVAPSVCFHGFHSKPLPRMNPFSDLDKRCGQRLCRSYARAFVQDQPADWILQTLGRLYFLRLHRYWPQFARPRSFSEKVWHRMLFERDPRWTM